MCLSLLLICKNEKIFQFISFGISPTCGVPWVNPDAPLTNLKFALQVRLMLITVVEIGGQSLIARPKLNL